ncbi:MAG: T9SS type A sorting domain-containing protein [Bacteroidota bacterium]|nr:T9SS type A sorting domain-containing protein [Bacteroidota bacterium]
MDLKSNEAEHPLNFTKMFRTFLSLLLLTNVLFAQSQPDIEWQRNLGGSLDDIAASIQQTSDGGYILCGTTYSNNGDVSGHHGNEDIWIVKLDLEGEIVWQRCLGGSQGENGDQILELTDGGYLVLGGTSSNDGDVTGNYGMIDFWLARLDSDGTLIWQHCFGGSLNDSPNDIKATPDGGFIIAGSSRSSDGDVTSNAGITDYWVLKLDADLDIEWQRSYGGTGVDEVFAIALTSDGGYILNGFTSSNDGDVSGAFGMEDYWVVKLNAVGNIQWQRPCGGSSSDFSRGVMELSDGSFMATGSSLSTDGDITDPLGSWDSWSIRLSALGQLLEDISNGGPNSDGGVGVVEAGDGGMIFCGSSSSNDGDVPNNQGGSDAWLFRRDMNGSILWTIALGGSQSDSFWKMSPTNDGGYITIGQSSSSNGDLTGNYGFTDIWVVKFGADPVGMVEISDRSFIDIYPNPTRDWLHFSSLCPDGDTSKWELLDARGRVVITGILSDPSAQINVEVLPPGTYSLFVECGKHRFAAPFVKQ